LVVMCTPDQGETVLYLLRSTVYVLAVKLSSLVWLAYICGLLVEVYTITWRLFAWREYVECITMAYVSWVIDLTPDDTKHYWKHSISCPRIYSVLQSVSSIVPLKHLNSFINPSVTCDSCIVIR